MARIQHLEVISGPTELFIGLGRDVQHDQHTKGWRWHLYLQSAKRASAALDAEVKAAIAARAAAKEATYLEAAE